MIRAGGGIESDRIYCHGHISASAGYSAKVPSSYPEIIPFFSFSFGRIWIDESATNELELASTRKEL